MATLYDLEQRVIALETLTAAMRTDITNLENTDVTHGVDITNAKSRLSNLETCCDGTDVAITNIQGTITSIQSTIASVQNTIADLPSDLDALTEVVDGIDDELTTVQNSVSGLQSSVGGIQSTVANVQSAQNTANGKISELETREDALTRQYAAQQIEINALKAQDVTTTAKVTQNTNAIANNTSAIDALESKHTDSGWRNLSLMSGWTKTPYATEDPQYRKIGNTVYLKGLVNATAAAGTTIATLPSGFSTPGRFFTRLAQSVGQTGVVNIQINQNGAIMDYTKGAQAREFLSLYGIVFTID